MVAMVAMINCLQCHHHYCYKIWLQKYDDDGDDDDEMMMLMVVMMMMMMYANPVLLQGV